MGFKKIIQKAVNAKAKTGLKSSIMVHNLDIYLSKSHRLSDAISIIS